jgi:hypothetical protein
MNYRFEEEKKQYLAAQDSPNAFTVKLSKVVINTLP